MMLANMVDFYTHDSLNWNLGAAIAVVLLLLAASLTLILFRLRGSGALLEKEI